MITDCVFNTPLMRNQEVLEMISRQDIYQKEAMELLRVLSEYRTLQVAQIVKLFPGKNSESIKNLITLLAKQKRIYTDISYELISVDERGLCDFDLSLIKCFWVLLDFTSDMSYHCTADYPSKLIFFAKNEVYEVVYVPESQEASIISYFALKDIDSKRIIVVEEEKQIEYLDIPDTVCFCTVNNTGTINYFTKE